MCFFSFFGGGAKLAFEKKYPEKIIYNSAVEVWKMICLLNWVIFLGSILIFSGVNRYGGIGMKGNLRY